MRGDRFGRWAKGVAYKKPVRVKQVPGASDVAGNVSVKLFQVLRARPFYFGYSRGRK
jgi:hypothetical protein